MPSVERFTIDTKDEADSFLTDLFKNPDDRSLPEIVQRGRNLIKDQELLDYFISEGKKLLVQSQAER